MLIEVVEAETIKIVFFLKYKHNGMHNIKFNQISASRRQA
jgi:hypothetical protein